MCTWSALGELLSCSAGRTVTMLHVQNGTIEKTHFCQWIVCYMLWEHGQKLISHQSKNGKTFFPNSELHLLSSNEKGSGQRHGFSVKVKIASPADC